MLHHQRGGGGGGNEPIRHRQERHRREYCECSRLFPRVGCHDCKIDDATQRRSLADAHSHRRRILWQIMATTVNKYYGRLVPNLGRRNDDDEAMWWCENQWTVLARNQVRVCVKLLLRRTIYLTYNSDESSVCLSHMYIHVELLPEAGSSTFIEHRLIMLQKYYLLMSDVWALFGYYPNQYFTCVRT